MAERSVDLNVDAGEGYDDAAVLRLVTSANLACGGHAGDEESLRPVVRLAAELGVVVGAQVSYVDRASFGRVPLETPATLLRDQLGEQLMLLDGLCRDVGSRVRYVKPHGALYHRTLAGGPQAEVVAELAARHALPLLLMPGSPYPAVAEGFADRAYDGGRLRPRDRPGAVLTEPATAARQALALADAGLRSICIHGDSPGAATIAAAVRSGLEEAGWLVRAFA